MFYKVGVLIMCVCATSLASASDLSKAWKQSQVGVFVPSSSQDVLDAHRLFSQMLQGQRVRASAWDALGMQVEHLRYKGEVVLVVHEQTQHQYGRGFFVIRQKETDSPLLLQAPHSFKDLYTGRIALKLWMAGNAKAAAWNTVPRWYDAQGQKVDADMAHRGETFFLAFSKAFAKRYPEGRTLQLHGFSQQKRETSQARSADIILSSGSKHLNSSVQHFGRCLKQQLTDQVLLYPTEVSELGGTRNVISRELRYHAAHDFIHMEMSFELRSGLRKDKDLRHRLLACL